MRRRTVKLTAILIGLLLVLGLVAYVLLLAVVPDRLILNAISSELGLDVTADSMSIGWTGHTRLRDVKVTLPMGDEEVLWATDIQLSHRAPLWLMITGSPGLENVKIESPGLQVKRNAGGRWNLQDVWTRVNAGRKTSDKSSGRIELPHVEVNNASIVVSDANGATETIGPISFEATTRGRSLWDFALNASPTVTASGQTAQGRDWSHSMSFQVQKITPLLAILTESDLGPVNIAGQWEGRLVGDALIGQLTLDRMQVGEVGVHGKTRIAVSSDGITLTPASLLVTEPNVAKEAIRITSGSVRLNGGRISVEQAGLEIGGLLASLDSQWASSTGLGDATISWITKPSKGDSQGQGTCQVSWRWPPLGRREIEMKLAATAKTGLGHGSVTAKILGTGQAWNESDWAVTIPKLAWTHGENDFDITDVEAALTMSDSSLQLTSLRWPNAQKLDAQAIYDLAAGKWSAQIQSQRVRFDPLVSQPVDIQFNGEGDSSKLNISQFDITQGQRTLTAKGELSLSDRSFRTLHVTANWPSQAKASAKTADPVPAGHWQCETDITGRLDPMAIKIQGVLKGTNVPLGKRVVPDVNIPVQADLDAKRIAVATEPFKLLEGQWRISGQHDWSNTLTQFSLVMEDLSLKSAASMAGSPVACRGRVRAELQLVAPGVRLQEAIAVGGWSAEVIEIPPFEARTAKGKVRIANGLVRFDEIQLNHEEGQANGRLQFRLDRPQNLSLTFNMTNWPILLGDDSMTFRLTGTADTQLDVVAKTMQGTSRLSGDILWKDKAFGRMTMANSVKGRTLAIQDLNIETLGGVIKGQAELPLDKRAQGTGQLAWENIDPNALEPWWPEASRFQGKLSGSLVAVRANEVNRPPEPTRIEINTEMVDGRFGKGQIRRGHIIAFLGPRRLLINQASFDLLGGQANARASISPHAGKFYATLVADVNHLDLDQLVHTIQTEAAEIPGRLTGNANFLVASDLSSFSGRADLDISESDLTGNGVVNALYQTMHLNLGSAQLEGSGQMQIQVNGSRLNIPSFVYFNRGVEIRGVGQIDDIWQGRSSPVRGYAFGSTRILKGLRLPGVRELDRVMSSLQSNAASVKIGGHLEKPKVEVVPLPAVTGALRRLLWAQLRGDEQEFSEAPSN